MESKAIPLVVFEKGSFNITDEAIEFLNSITGKIAVIAVVGKYRTGKSFLLNRIILDYKGKGGFGVGPTINPCTKGLWIWSEGVEIQQDGEKITVLVIDSEGLGAFDEDANHDTRIFLMALLLSSYFIYNSVGSIDENALSNLSLIVNLSKQIQTRSGSSSLEDIHEYFPSFLWVLRDFALRLVDSQGNTISTKDYLENSLAPSKGVSDSVEAKNRIRRLLTSFFKERDCFALIRPTESEKALQRLDEADESVFRPEFLELAGKLRRHIYRKAKVKMLNKTCLNGEMLAQLAKTYVNAINSGAVPNIEGAWSSVCNAECMKTVEESLGLAEKQARGLVFPMDEKSFKAKFKDIVDAAVENFKAKALGDNSQNHLNGLLGKLKEKKVVFAGKNFRNHEEKAIKAIQEWTVEVQDLAREGKISNLTEFKAIYDKFLQTIDKATPAKVKEKLIGELGNAQIIVIEQISKNNETLLNNNIRKLSAQLELQQDQFNRKKEEMESEKDYMRNRTDELEKEYNSVKGNNAILLAKNEELSRQKKKVEEISEEKVSSLKQKSTDKINELKKKLEILNEKNRNNENSYTKQVADLQRENLLLKQELEFKNAEIKDLRERMDEANKKERKVKHLSVDSTDRRSENNDWPAEKSLLKSQIDSLKAHIEDNKAIQEALMLALNSKSSENPQHIDKAYETTKHLSYALEKSEENCKKLEAKLLKAKKFHKMVKNCSALQCRRCTKFQSVNGFNSHFQSCEGLNKESSALIVSISKASIKETDSKPYTEYLISVSNNGKNLAIPRKYKMFCYLHQSLQQTFPNFDMPELIVVQDKLRTVEDRRKVFENYLIQLAQVSFIRESTVFKRFLGIDMEIEQIQSPLKSKRIKSNIELVTSRAFSPSMSILTPVTNTFETKFQGK